MLEAVPKTKLPQKSMDPRTAYHLIHDELQTQGNPTLNMASFVTTIMDEECDRLISEKLGVNYIDTEVYSVNGAARVSRCQRPLPVARSRAYTLPPASPT